MFLRWNRLENILGQIHSFWYHRWKQFYKYGDIEITINLSKPEKDPKEIMKAKQSKPVVIPNAFYVKKMWVLQETLIIPQGKIIVLSH